MDTRKNCDGHRDPSSSQQHRGCRECTDVEAKQHRLYDGGVHQTPAAIKGNSKRRRLGFQNKKAAEAEASPSQRTRRRAFFRSRTRREMLLTREWGKLGSAIRRAAAVCLAPSSTGADEDDELDRLPYVQLDKQVTRAVVSREAFGPLYLVT